MITQLLIDPDWLLTIWLAASAGGLTVTMTLRYRLMPTDPRPTPKPVRPGFGYGGRHWATDPAAEGRRDWYRAAHTTTAVRYGRHCVGHPVRSLVHTSELTGAELAGLLTRGVR